MFFENLDRLLRVGEYYSLQAKRIAAGQVTQIIRRQFAATDLSFVTDKDYGVDPNMVIVSGTYDSDDDSVEITLSYNPEQKIYNTKLLDWPRLSFDVCECVVHELIHREQHHSGRRFSKYRGLTEEQTYLGDEAEIDAYAFSIVADSLVHSKPYHESAMFRTYKKTFDNDPKVILKLEKQISKYFNRLEPNYEQNSRDCTRV